VSANARADIERLYEQHGRVLLAYACSFVRSVAEGEDIVQQVFTRLLRGDVVITGPPLAYLCRAIRNTALNQRRTWHRETSLDGDVRWLEAPAGLEESALAIERSMAAAGGAARGRDPARVGRADVLRDRRHAGYLREHRRVAVWICTRQTA
jgi:DNA-directed RNA polymerase specialized sigma24 family protein